MSSFRLKELQRHSWDLSLVLFDAWHGGSQALSDLKLLQPAEWLRLAAGVQNVQVDAAAFDDLIACARHQ